MNSGGNSGPGDGLGNRRLHIKATNVPDQYRPHNTTYISIHAYDSEYIDTYALSISPNTGEERRCRCFVMKWPSLLWTTIDCPTDEFTPTATSKYTLTAFEYCGSQYIVLFGGNNTYGSTLSALRAFSISDSRWIDTRLAFSPSNVPSALPMSRACHTATYVSIFNQPFMVVVGGYTTDTPDRTIFVQPSMQILHLPSGSWSPTLHVPARYRHSAVLVPSRSSRSQPRILVIGGRDAKGQHNDPSFVIDLRYAIGVIAKLYINAAMASFWEEFDYIETHSADSAAKYWYPLPSPDGGHFEGNINLFTIPNIDSTTVYIFSPMTGGGSASLLHRLFTLDLESGFARYSEILLPSKEISTLLERMSLDGDIQWPCFSLLAQDQANDAVILVTSLYSKSHNNGDQQFQVLLTPLPSCSIPPPPPTISQHLRALIPSFNTPFTSPTSDFTIIPTSSPNSLPLPVHLSILSARCPYFATLLHSSLSETTSKVLELKEPYEIVWCLIYWIYTNELPCIRELAEMEINTKSLSELLITSEKFLLPDMATQVKEAILNSGLDTTDMPFVWRAALLTGHPYVQPSQSRKKDSGAEWDWVYEALDSVEDWGEGPGEKFIGYLAKWCWRRREEVMEAFDSVLNDGEKKTDSTWLEARAELEERISAFDNS